MDGLGIKTPRKAIPIPVFLACEGLSLSAPRLSAKRTLTWGQALVFCVAAAGLGFAAWKAPWALLAGLHVLGMVVFAAAILVRLGAAAASLTRRPAPVAVPPVLPVLTVLCPLYREAQAVPDLLAALARLDYPPDLLDVKIILEADDEETIAAVRESNAATFCEIVVVPVCLPRTKPKALNFALGFARGTLVTVFDAEDRPHPQQPKQAAAAFAADLGASDSGRLACVQAPLLVDNERASWIADQFAAEYAIQFGAMLPFLARLGVAFPLGGTSNYFRVDALWAVKAWDPYNVTEDADIGFRLARAGYRLGVIDAPTFEEAPVRFSAWRRQRTRWIKGHMQTWLVLMRAPWVAYRELGAASFWMMQLVLGGGILAALVHGPLAAGLLITALAPALSLEPPDLILALSGYVTAAYAALAAAAVTGQLGVMRAALTMPLYWPLATVAALHALGELIVKPHYWAKTTHGLSQRKKHDARQFLPGAGRLGG